MKTPTIALFTGDPAGIGPELVAKVLADPRGAADARASSSSRSRSVLEAGCARCRRDARPAGGDRGRRARQGAGIVRLQWDGWTAPASRAAQATADNGAFMLDALRVALDLWRIAASVDAVCFAPLNKAALRAGGMTAGRRAALVCARSSTITARAASSTCWKRCGRRA